MLNLTDGITQPEQSRKRPGFLLAQNVQSFQSGEAPCAAVVISRQNRCPLAAVPVMDFVRLRTAAHWPDSLTPTRKARTCPSGRRSRRTGKRRPAKRSEVTKVGASRGGLIDRGDTFLVAFLAPAVVLMKELAECAGMRPLELLQTRPAFQQFPYQGATQSSNQQSICEKYSFRQPVRRLLSRVFSSTVCRRCSSRKGKSRVSVVSGCSWLRFSRWRINRSSKDCVSLGFALGPGGSEGLPVPRLSGRMDREQHQVWILGEHIYTSAPQDCSKITAIGRPPKRCCRLAAQASTSSSLFKICGQDLL